MRYICFCKITGKSKLHPPTSPIVYACTYVFSFCFYVHTYIFMQSIFILIFTYIKIKLLRRNRKLAPQKGITKGKSMVSIVLSSRWVAKQNFGQFQLNFKNYRDRPCIKQLFYFALKTYSILRLELICNQVLKTTETGHEIGIN